MKIASASLQLASTHYASQENSVQERLRVWVGKRPEQAARPVAADAEKVPPPKISDAGYKAHKSDLNDDINHSVDNDPKLALIRSMLEFMTGRRVNLFDPSVLDQPVAAESLPAQGPARDAPPPPPSPSAGYGLEYDYHSSYTETESTSFSASGTVNTADGKTISFSISLSMQRSYHEEQNISVRAGDAQMKDPLVLNFAGNAAELSNTTFKFDLQNDGKLVDMPSLSGSSGFLAFDRNQDGKINNGSELFGPQTGNGFQEFSALDDDQNGWIDENDAAWSDLRIWNKTVDGTDRLQSLKEAGVGALSLAHVATPFDLKDSSNTSLGKILNTGIFLGENGDVGSIQQIDVAV